MLLSTQLLEKLENQSFICFDAKGLSMSSMDHSNLTQTDNNDIGYFDSLINEAESLFTTKKNDFRQAGITLNKQIQTEIRGDEILWLNADLAPLIYQFLENVKKQLCEFFLISINEFEAHLAHYPAGKGYLKHIDQAPNTQNKRLFTLLFYFNKNWTDQDGGELLIFDPNQPNQILEKVPPSYGNMVMFFSDNLPHQVAKTNSERKSLTVWFRHDIIR